MSDMSCENSSWPMSVIIVRNTLCPSGGRHEYMNIDKFPSSRSERRFYGGHGGPEMEVERLHAECWNIKDHDMSQEPG